MLIASHNGLDFRLQPDNSEIGVYLIVYRDGTCVADHLQDDIAMCKRAALEDYGVPYDAWHEADPQSKASRM